jgi:amino acid transporter
MYHCENGEEKERHMEIKPLDQPKRSPLANLTSLPSEDYVAKAMPPVLGAFDMTSIFVIAIFWIINATTAATGGAVAFVYWIAGAILFFLPCVIAIAQLGVLFPHDGSLYTWTQKALGNYWSFFVGICYWFPGPLALVIAASAFTTYLQGLNNAWLTQPWQQGVVMIAFIALSGVLATRRLRLVQNVVNMAAVLTLLAFVLVALSGIVWLFRGHTSATSFVNSSDWGINPQNIGLFGLITLGYLGTQIPLNMGGEATGGRKMITQHLGWGALLVVIGYLVTTFSLLVVRGPAILSAPVLNFELVTTVDVVFGKLLGNITAVCIMSFFVATAVVYNTASARLLLVGAIDKRIPLHTGKLNKERVPVNAIRFQTIIAIVFTAFAFLIVPTFSFLGKPADLANEVYNIALATLTLVWVLASIFLFVDLFSFYFRDRVAFHKQRIFPMPLLWACAILGTITCVAVIGDTLLNSWIPQINNANWFTIVGVLTFICFIIVSVGSMLATSEANWENMETEY